MLIDECVNSVIIVDNKEDEMKDLIKVFTQRDIRVDSFLYGKEELRSFQKNRQLVFVDLLLNENPGQGYENMSMLIDTLHKLCSDSFGLYGLIVWTKHPEMLGELKERISKAAFENKKAHVEDDEEEDTSLTIQPPLFILALNKNKYIRAGYDYSSLPQDIEDALKQDTAAYFFFKWNASVQSSKDKTVKGIYQLIRDYKKQEKQLPYILYQLALNQTGSPNHHSKITIDAYKAFDELFFSDLMSLQRNETEPVFNPNIQNSLGDDYKYRLMLSAMLNEQICIDTTSIVQDLIVPGNVYRIKDINSPLKVKLDERPHTSNLKNVDTAKVDYIAIELTPPCDFSQRYKKLSRLVGGYVFDIPILKNENGKYIKYTCHNADKTYELWPVSINDDKARCVVFDFRYLYSPIEVDILNPLKYEAWFRAKPKLFSDILQKFSSHASRLGISSINLT